MGEHIVGESGDTRFLGGRGPRPTEGGQIKERKSKRGVSGNFFFLRGQGEGWKGVYVGCQKGKWAEKINIRIKIMNKK